MSAAAGMPELPIRHVARVVVLDAERTVLLVRYEETAPPRSYWGPPGGALKPGESPVAAAQRELTEETGLVAQIGPYSGTDVPPSGWSR